MTADEIRAEIDLYGDKIDELNSKINTLRNKQYELELLTTKFNNLKTKFENHQELRKTRLSSVTVIKNIKSAEQYFNGMKDLLSSSDFVNTDDALGEDVEKIRGKQSEMESEITVYSAQIDSYDDKISELRVLLKTELNSDSTNS